MGKVTAFFRLTRIEHSIMLVFAVIAAELIAKGLPSIPILALSLITPIFISMASFAINDYFDVESDRLNKRFERPLVSGELGKSSALGISVVCLLIGIGASVFINLNAFAIALIFGILAVLYSYKLKDMLLLGNLYIGLSMAIPFLFGNFVVSQSINYGILVILFISFLSGTAREIHGMIRDYKGDSKARKSKNLVAYVTRGRAAQIAFILYLEAVILSVFLFFFAHPFRFNITYIIPIGIADVMLMYTAVACLFSDDRRTYKMIRNVSLAAMGIAILGYLLAPLLSITI
ncbi:MAG TPA: UbiA family prenyltransferase [Candidatus Acidoferrum sp.]|nr:UbiA family prenyltransferase [Candidatus Acidoferrum sp.]